MLDNNFFYLFTKRIHIIALQLQAMQFSFYIVQVYIKLGHCILNSYSSLLSPTSATTRSGIVVILIIDNNELLSYPIKTVPQVMDV